jgi:hypothetical protein
MSNDLILCSDCGWSGKRSELTDAGETLQYPVCTQAVEIVD